MEGEALIRTTYSDATHTRNLLVQRRNKNRRPRTRRADFLTLTHSKRTYKRNVQIRRRNASRKAATHCSNGVAVKATNKVHCLTPHLFSQSLTAQALFTLKMRRTKTQTTIPCECLLGGCALCAQVEKFERRYGRDALNNTSCECVVAKANEADCLANAEVQTREEGGSFN